MITKIDLKIEAARMAIETGFEGFEKKSREIYNFLVEDIEVPSNEPDPKSMFEAIQTLLPFKKVEDGKVNDKKEA